jgi:hypothetical protein
MTATVFEASVEDQIGQWREYLRRRQAIHPVDVAELEDHLREQVAGLVGAGLDGDEAFLVAVKRLGNLDALSREFALEHSGRLWKQLVLPAESDATRARARRDTVVALALAVAAAVAVKVPALFGLEIGADRAFYLRNASFFVLPMLVTTAVWPWVASRISRARGVTSSSCSTGPEVPGSRCRPGCDPDAPVRARASAAMRSASSRASAFARSRAPAASAASRVWAPCS